MLNRMARLLVGLLLLGPSFVVRADHPPDCPPTNSPAPTETAVPSPSPSPAPSDTQKPSSSLYPSSSPTEYPTTSEPSDRPTESPTESPAPSPSPTASPTDFPTAFPTVSAAPTITQAPSPAPSDQPTLTPSSVPSDIPSAMPSVAPTPVPTITPKPSPEPTVHPSEVPTINPTASAMPTSVPTLLPTISRMPSAKPTDTPSLSPTMSPAPTTSMPSSLPSLQPTSTPSSVPSTEPTATPTVSSAPSTQPTITPMPSVSIAPSTTPSSNPTAGPRIFKSQRITISMFELSTKMDADVQTLFEQTTVRFINDNLKTHKKPKITVQEVEVTGQQLLPGRRLQTSTEGFDDLNITFTVTASVWRGDPENFDFAALLMRESFTVEDVLRLRKILNEISSFFGEFSPGGSQGGTGYGQGSISTEVSRGFPIPVIGAVAGVLLSITGSAMLFYWWRGRRSDESIGDSRDFDLEDPAYSKDITYSRSSSSSDDGCHLGDPSHILVKHPSLDASESSMPLGARRLEHDTNLYPVKSIETSVKEHDTNLYPVKSIGTSVKEHDTNLCPVKSIGTSVKEHDTNLYPVKSIETSVTEAYGAGHFAQNLLQFESNIEVPETPGPETPSKQFDLHRFDEVDVEVPSVAQSLDVDLEKQLYQGWNDTDARNQKGHMVVIPVNEVEESQQSSRSVGRSNSDLRLSIRMADVKKIFQGWNSTDAGNKKGHKVVVPVNEVKGSQQGNRSLGQSKSDLRQSIRRLDVTSDAPQMSNCMVEVKKIFQGWNTTDAGNKKGHKVVVPVNEVKEIQQSSLSLGQSNSDIRRSILMVDINSNAEQVSNITHRSESLDGDSRTMMSSAIEPFDDEEVVMIEDQNIAIIDEIGYLHKEQSSRESSLSMTKGQSGLLGNLYIASRSNQKLRKAELSETSFGSGARNRASGYLSEDSDSSAEL